MNYLKTSSGTFEYVPVNLNGRTKPIDGVICKKNLINVKAIFSRDNIHFGLWGGTLLGAIREADFIKGDTDVDVFVLFEQQQNVLDCMPSLCELGFKVARYCVDDLISIIREDDYIDIYFYKRRGKNRVCIGNFIGAHYLEQRDEIAFLGDVFPTPSHPKEVLKRCYGRDWLTPKAFSKKKNLTLNGKAIRKLSTLRLGVIKRFPKLQRLYRGCKRLFVS